MPVISGDRTFFSFLTDETTITAADFKFLLGGAVVYYFYRRLLIRFLLKPLSTLVTNSNTSKQEHQRYKFIHRGFDLIHYLTATCLGLVAANFLPYGRCPFYFAGCHVYAVQTRPSFTCSRLVKGYYALFVAYYISDIPFVGTTTEVGLLIVHHSVSLALELLAFLAGRPVITFSCNLLHDIVDVFLYLGKILSYLKFKLLADLILLLFSVSYLWFRLINFGMVIYAFWFVDVGDQIGFVWAYQACRVLVFALLFCHVIWFYQICRAFRRMLSFGREEIKDARSDKAVKEKVRTE
jgi:hypothetical protein